MKELTCKVICKICFGDKIDNIHCKFINKQGQEESLTFENLMARSLGESFNSFFELPLDVFTDGFTVTHDIGKERQRLNRNEREALKHIRQLIEDRINTNYVPKRKDILSYYIEHKEEMSID